MLKPAALFVAAAMAVTAACVGLIVGFGLGLGVGPSALAGLGALALMAVTQLAFARTPEPDHGRLDDLDRLVTELQSRLETAELRIQTLDGAAAERARAATRPVVEEIAALSGLVTSIAKEVAAHDVRLVQLAGALPGAAAGPARPVKAETGQATPLEPAVPDEAPAQPPPAPRKARSAPPRPPAPEPLDPDEPESSDSEEPPVADRGAAARLELALRDDRIDIHLQPIVSLPSRRTLHYEALSRLVEPGGLLEAHEFIRMAADLGSLPEIDRRAVERSCGVALRLAASGRSGAIFVNLAAATLARDDALAAIVAAVEKHSELSRLIVAELPQAAFLGLDQKQRAAIVSLKERGVRFSLDEATDLRVEPRDLAQRGVRFLKVRAARLLDPEAAQGASIHPAELSGLLSRHGVELIATHVEEARTVPELLDMEVRAAQGFLFGAARPVRPAASAATAAAPAPEARASAPAMDPDLPKRLVPRAFAAR